MTVRCAMLALLLSNAGCEPPPVDCGGREDPERGPRVDWFRDVTAESGVQSINLPRASNPIGGSGVAVADVDGDGALDLVATAGVRGPTRVYRNLGELRFEDITAQSPSPLVAANGATLADLDGDGDADLVLADESGGALYENEGGGRFRRRDGGSLLPAPTAGGGVLAADFDGDGLLDLYYYAYQQNSATRTRSQLLRNRGGFAFDDLTASYGLGEQGYTWTVSWFDYDGDGAPDLYVANDTFVNDAGAQGMINVPRGLPDALFHSDGSPGAPHFTDRAKPAGLADPRSSMGGLVSDFDGDGRLDLYVSNVGRNHLLINGGNGTFTNQTDRFGVGATRRSNALCPDTATDERCLLVSWGAARFDADHDGIDDLLMVDGAVDEPADQPSVEYRGGPGGEYREVSAGIGCQRGRALVPADFDGDGDLDLVITSYSGPLRLMRNQAPAGRGWLRVRLIGKRSNRDGVGATVTALMQGGRRVVRAVGAGGIVHSSAPVEAHFVAADDSIDALEIRWPSGTVQTVTPVPRDQVIAISEP